MTEPRTLLGWTVPEHMHTVTSSAGYHHITCRSLVHVGGFPGQILSPLDEDLPTLAGHWLRDHAHGEVVEYRPTPEPATEDCLGSGHAHDPEDLCPASESVAGVSSVSPEGETTPGEGEGAREALAALISPDAWAAEEADQDTMGAQWRISEGRWLSKSAAARILAAGWRPPRTDCNVDDHPPVDWKGSCQCDCCTETARVMAGLKSEGWVSPVELERLLARRPLSGVELQSVEERDDASEDQS